MEELKNIYEKEIELLQIFQKTIFYGLEFDKIDFETKEVYNLFQKKLYKKIKNNIEIECKETVYKKWTEKYLNIKIKINKEDYEIYTVIINPERIKLVLKTYLSGEKTTLSKQYGLNGHVIYKYSDNKNNYILHQNVNNLFYYLEDFSNNENIYSNIFSGENDSIKHISKLPFNIIYESIVNCKVFDEKQLNDYIKAENKKRIATNSNELKIIKETNKNIENHISKIKIVRENTKSLDNNFNEKILKNSQINQIFQKGEKIIEEINTNENLTLKNENEISELEILKNQKLEFEEMKKTTEEIINKLQNILIN